MSSGTSCFSAVLLLFVVCHIVTGIAWNFTVLGIGRSGIACAHAIFWLISISLVVRLAPPDQTSRTLGLLATGTSLAMIAGIPLGRLVGEALGRRMIFQVIAVVVFLLLGLALPALPASRQVRYAACRCCGKPDADAHLSGHAASRIAHLTAYIYTEPLIEHVNHASGGSHYVYPELVRAAGIPAAIAFDRLCPHEATSALQERVVGPCIEFLRQFACLVLGPAETAGD